MHNSIQLTQPEPGLWQLTYFGKPTGYITPIRNRSEGDPCWRAITIHNCIKHFHTLNAARQWLLDTYH